MERRANNIDALAGDLSGLESITDKSILRQRSRDFYWYSPVLRRQLDDVRADLRTRFRTMTAAAGGRIAFERSRFESHMPPLFEFTGNHTTLQALEVDPGLTYLQSLFPPGRHLELVEHMHARFGDEVATHLEFVHSGGEVACLR